LESPLAAKVGRPEVFQAEGVRVDARRLV
jgi:hypothetical protein